MILLLDNTYFELYVTSNPACASETNLVKYRLKSAGTAILTIGNVSISIDNTITKQIDISEIVRNNAFSNSSLPFSVNGITPAAYNLTASVGCRYGLFSDANTLNVPSEIAYFDDGFPFYIQSAENNSIEWDGENITVLGKSVKADYEYYCNYQKKVVSWRTALDNSKSWAFDVIGYEQRTLEAQNLLYSNNISKATKIKEYIKLRAELNREQQLYLVDLFGSQAVSSEGVGYYIDGMDKLECTDTPKTIEFYIYKR